jgi:hypothetical protein
VQVHVTRSLALRPSAVWATRPGAERLAITDLVTSGRLRGPGLGHQTSPSRKRWHSRLAKVSPVSGAGNPGRFAPTSWWATNDDDEHYVYAIAL